MGPTPKVNGLNAFYCEIHFHSKFSTQYFSAKQHRELLRVFRLLATSCYLLATYERSLSTQDDGRGGDDGRMWDGEVWEVWPHQWGRGLSEKVAPD